MAGEQLVGSVLAGRYRVVQLLGTGGTADLYVGQCLAPGPSLAGGEVRPGDHVALKVLRASHEHDRGAVARFQREALAAARAACSNVVAVHEVAFEHQPMFFATELLVGLDLADTLAAARRLEASRAVRIARAALDGLAVAHGRGVLHRDVKPENIFLVHSPDGREIVKLIDFGLAWDETEADEAAQSPRRITARAHVVGTPEYMAPEQLVGERPTASWDLYALGVVVFEMLAGVLPFRGDDYADIARQHLSAAPPLLSSVRPAVGVSAGLEAWVDKALRKDPRFRHASAGEMAGALSATAEARTARPREP